MMESLALRPFLRPHSLVNIPGLRALPSSPARRVTAGNLCPSHGLQKGGIELHDIFFMKLFIGFTERAFVLFTQFPPKETPCMSVEQCRNQEMDIGITFQIWLRLHRCDTHSFRYYFEPLLAHRGLPTCFSSSL